MFTDQQSILPCPRCLNIGLWISPTNEVVECPGITVGEIHPGPTESGKLVRRAVDRMKREGIVIATHPFEIARMLTLFSSERPCTRKGLLDQFFNYLPMSERNQIRQLQKVVETLRKEWLLPIGSRKDAPDGYWIITDTNDFHAWVKRSMAAPITQITTIRSVARQNFPIFAEQLEIEFFSDVEPDLRPAA